MRKVIDLNGIWELSLDKRFNPTQTYFIEVPNCIGNQIPALRDYRGVVWYRKEFEIDKDKDSRYLLYFGAVNYYAEVWLNDTLVGNHEGGYTPFIFDVSSVIKPKSRLLVKVIIPGEADPNYPFSEIPHGKQETQWYGMAGGIWQEVKLIQTGLNYVKSIKITPDVDNSKVRITLTTEIDKEDTYRLYMTIIDPKGKEISGIETPLKKENLVELDIKDPILWDVDNPNLYTLKVGIRDKNKVYDELEETFGMRKVEIKDENILLNNRPVYLIGALDQDFYPFTHYNPPSEEFVRDQLILAKEMGLNCLRYHIKVPHPWYLKWTDRLGILVWYDLPNWNRSTLASRSRGEKLLEEMIEYDFNHPSVIIRTIINENWGLDLVNSGEDREWLKRTYEWFKKKDPTRIVVDNSACFPNFHVKTDIEDFHNYFAFPDKFKEMQKWVADFSKHPSWTFAPDGERRGDEPLVVSEFGNWGLPNITKLRAQYGGDPWWFQQRDTTTATKPLGVEERFWQYGLDKVFDTIENLSETFQELQHQALRFQIEEIRKHPDIKGYIITEFTDLYWECNGLLDITRGKKSYFNDLKNINSLDLVFPKERPTGVWSGENISIPILFSHLSNEDLDNVKIVWGIEGTELKEGITLAQIPYGLTEVGNIEFQAPVISEPKTFKITLRATSRNRIINENTIPIFVVPKNLIKLGIGVLDNALRKPLEDAGIIPCEITETNIIYASSFSEELERLAKDGKTVILELSGDTKFSRFGYVLERRKGITEARWVGGLGIFNPKIGGRTFKEKIMDYRFINDSPINYLYGEFNFSSRTLVGMIIGWLYYPMNFMVDIPLGNGSIILHTFPIIDRLSSSPVMRALLGQMVGGR
ncbi:MAG: glycoside hydrolase family 2 protein [bacterium]